MIVDDVAPLELNNCRIAYLEISMLTAAFIPYTGTFWFYHKFWI